MKAKLTEADPAGLYLCDRGEKADIVVYWTGHAMTMANYGGSLPLEYFSNFRRLVVQTEVPAAAAPKPAKQKAR